VDILKNKGGDKEKPNAGEKHGVNQVSDYEKAVERNLKVTD